MKKILKMILMGISLVLLLLIAAAPILAYQDSEAELEERLAKFNDTSLGSCKEVWLGPCRDSYDHHVRWCKEVWLGPCATVHVQQGGVGKVRSR